MQAKKHMNANQIRVNNFYITSEPHVMPTPKTERLRLGNKRLSERGKTIWIHLGQPPESWYHREGKYILYGPKDTFTICLLKTIPLTWLRVIVTENLFTLKYPI